MKPVDQKQFYDPDVDGSRGDCLSACIASILELPLEDVPIFRGSKTEAWDAEMVRWLGKRGLTFLWVQPSEHGLDPWVVAPWGSPTVYAIASGVSPRSTEKCHFRHAVVWEFVGDGSSGLAHDPHPSRDGIPKVQDYKILLPVQDAA